MKKALLSLVALTAAGLAVVGCSGTAEGVANDASNNVNAVANAPEAVANAASNGVNAVANTAENAANAVANTGEAVANAASNGVNAAANAAENAGQAVASTASNAANAAANAGSATLVTSQVKLAITANKDLNEDGNLINVDTKDGKIVLSGHVKNATLKKTAQTIAEKVKKDRNFSETVQNNLTVGG
jgi:osmotically-inducible protein OsmY